MEGAPALTRPLILAGGGLTHRFGSQVEMSASSRDDESARGGGSSGVKWTSEDVEALMEPYVRRSPKCSALEVIRTAFAAVFLLPIRVLFMLLCCVPLWIFSNLAMVGIPKAKRKDILLTPLHPLRNCLIRAMFPIFRALAFVSFGIFNIEFTRAAKRGDNPTEATVVVANHLGYIDILILSCVYRASFVSKADIENLPVVGSIATALQTLFLRKGESLTSQLVTRVQQTHECFEKRHRGNECESGGGDGEGGMGPTSCLNKLVIFPEGTTANGRAMVTFRTGVFNAGKPVQPVCVSFPHKHWNMSWETIRFRTHLFRTMTQFYNRVAVTELPVYVPSEAEIADARLYASNVQKLMSNHMEQSIYRLNRKHKFLYHRFVLGNVDPDQVRVEAAKITSEDSLLSYLNEVDAQSIA